jgi:hypothetical protein
MSFTNAAALLIFASLYAIAWILDRQTTKQLKQLTRIADALEKIETKIGKL